MPSKAASVAEYLKSLPEDRRRALEAVRKVIRANLDGNFEEGVQYGMIGYFVPHSFFPAGYHCDPAQPLCFAGLASQKNHMSVYLMSVYGNAEHARWFQNEWKKSGKKLDMGKSCVRFKKLEDLSLEAIGGAIERVDARSYVDAYLKARGEHAAAKTKAKAAPSPKKPARAKAGAAAGRRKS